MFTTEVINMYFLRRYSYEKITSMWTVLEAVTCTYGLFPFSLHFRVKQEATCVHVTCTWLPKRHKTICVKYL